MKPDVEVTGHGVPGGRPEVRPGTVRPAERKRGLGAKEWSGSAFVSSQNCVSSLILREAPHLCVCQHRGVGFRRRRGSSPSQQTF